jgi:hypothetical protein
MSSGTVTRLEAVLKKQSAFLQVINGLKDQGKLDQAADKVKKAVACVVDKAKS